MRPGKPPLQFIRQLKQVREQICYLNYSLNIEKLYAHQLRFLIFVNEMKHPREMWRMPFSQLKQFYQYFQPEFSWAIRKPNAIWKPQPGLKIQPYFSPPFTILAAPTLVS